MKIETVKQATMKLLPKKTPPPTPVWDDPAPDYAEPQYLTGNNLQPAIKLAKASGFVCVRIDIVDNARYRARFIKLS